MKKNYEETEEGMKEATREERISREEKRRKREVGGSISKGQDEGKEKEREPKEITKGRTKLKRGRRRKKRRKEIFRERVGKKLSGALWEQARRKERKMEKRHWGEAEGKVGAAVDEGKSG